MTTYRAYQLDRRNRIKSGTWIYASSAAEAHDMAAELCEEGVDSIELWQAQTKVDEIDCPPVETPVCRLRSSR
jgi:hypothetical protein